MKSFLGVGKSFVSDEDLIPKTTGHPKAEKSTKVFFDTEYLETNVYQLQDLLAGDLINGPAIIMDKLSTILVEPDCTAMITLRGDIKITIGAGDIQRIGTDLDSVQLSIFGHRFMSIAEQMGR